MPLYEFSCDECHKQFEELILFSRCKDEKVLCPDCGSSKVRRMQSGFATPGRQTRKPLAASNCRGHGPIG